MIKGTIPQLADILLLIGPLQTPIQKIPTSKKQLIKAWIADNGDQNVLTQPEILLRAHLSIRENPPPQMVQASTIIGALERGDILRYSKRLCLSSQIIDATALFVGLKTAFEKSTYQTPFQLIRKIVPSVRKWLKWVDSIEGCLTETTEIALIDFFALLAQRAAPSKGLSGKKLKSVEKMITPLFEFSLGLSAKSPHLKTLIQTMNLIGFIGEKFSISLLEDVLEDENRHRLLEQTIKRIPDHVKESAYKGRVDRIEDMSRAVRRVYTANMQFRKTICELWEKEAGTLTEEVRQFIREYLEISQGITPKSITLADQSESLQVAQLATSLLSSWEAREDSARATNAFHLLHSVAQKFFNLKICGQVKSIVQFDNRVHEFPGTPIGEGQVVIIRPWVEWTEGSHTKVIIRAIVEQVKQR